VVVSLDDHEACRVEVAGSAPLPVYCRATLPREARRLTIEWGKSPGSRKRREYSLHSVAQITSSVRQEPAAASIGRLISRVDALLAALGSDVRADDIGLALETKVPRDALAAAEGRLGFSLDAELKELMETKGRVVFGDSWMVRPEEFDITERQFKRVWGHGEKAGSLASAIYRTSTMVWVEAGDGYGAVVYQPMGPDRCGGRPAYWRIHQESIDEPELITAGDGACGGLRDALFAMFVRDVLDQVADDAADDQLLVDPSAAEFTLWLGVDRDGVPRLRSDWTKLR
jgi:hypothetical protein